MELLTCITYVTFYTIVIDVGEKWDC